MGLEYIFPVVCVAILLRAFYNFVKVGEPDTKNDEYTAAMQQHTLRITQGFLDGPFDEENYFSPKKGGFIIELEDEYEKPLNRMWQCLHIDEEEARMILFDNKKDDYRIADLDGDLELCKDRWKEMTPSDIVAWRKSQK